MSCTQTTAAGHLTHILVSQPVSVAELGQRRKAYLRNESLQAGKGAHIRRHPDVGFLYAEEGILRAPPDVACADQVHGTPDDAPLAGHQHGDPRRLQTVERGLNEGQTAREILCRQGTIAALRSDGPFREEAQVQTGRKMLPRRGYDDGSGSSLGVDLSSRDRVRN